MPIRYQPEPEKVSIFERLIPQKEVPKPKTKKLVVFRNLPPEIIRDPAPAPIEIIRSEFTESELRDIRNAVHERMKHLQSFLSVDTTGGIPEGSFDEIMRLSELLPKIDQLRLDTFSQSCKDDLSKKE